MRGSVCGERRCRSPAARPLACLRRAFWTLVGVLGRSTFCQGRSQHGSAHPKTAVPGTRVGGRGPRKVAGLCVREDMAGFHRREPARMRPTLAFPQSPRSLARKRERGGRKARIVGALPTHARGRAPTIPARAGKPGSRASETGLWGNAKWAIRRSVLPRGGAQAPRARGNLSPPGGAGLRAAFAGLRDSSGTRHHAVCLRRYSWVARRQWHSRATQCACGARARLRDAQ